LAAYNQVTKTNTLVPASGLRANWRQFALLLLVNAFVGAMLGLERATLPLLAESEFGLTSKSVSLSFLIGFGLVKALGNLAAGSLSDRWGRKRILVAGWLAGLPVPLILINATSWNAVVFANVLLGINQGLCWSAAVIMKIDLAGARQRGLALGLNESAGYLAVGLSALLAGYLAAGHGLRPAPFYPGLVFALLGLLLSGLVVRETLPLAKACAPPRAALPFGQVMYRVSWGDRSLFSISQAGLVNNLNDGVIWGLAPVLLAQARLPLEQIGLIAAFYPGVWGLCQLATGALSDAWGRKRMIVAGFLIQALGIALFIRVRSLLPGLLAAGLLGLGTALVYPTLLAAVSDRAEPRWRASAVGIYRLWRDLGYVIGAILAGWLADYWGLPASFAVVASLTLLSGLTVQRWMQPDRDLHLK